MEPTSTPNRCAYTAAWLSGSSMPGRAIVRRGCRASRASGLSGLLLGLVLTALLCAVARAEPHGLQKPDEAIPEKASVGPLMDELHAVDRLRHTEPRTDFITALKAWRRRVDAFTRTHSGSALDAIEWAIPFQTCYEWWGEALCATHEESEAHVRDAIGVLRAATPDDKRLAPRIVLHLAVSHAHRWVEGMPMKCAALLDEIEEIAPWSDDPALHRYWAFLVPTVEGNFLGCMGAVSPDARERFHAEREKKLLAYMDDERIPLEWRTRMVWRRARQLDYVGEMTKAVTLLDGWWRRYGDAIEGAEFFHIYLRVSLFGEGNWEKAADILERATALAPSWKRSFYVSQFKAMTRTYYLCIRMPGYELQRQYAILKASRRRAP